MRDLGSTPPLSSRAKRLAAAEEEINRTLSSELATLADVDEAQQAIEVIRDWMHGEYGRIYDSISLAQREAERARTTDADSRRRDTWLWAAVLVISIWQIVDVVIRYV